MDPKPGTDQLAELEHLRTARRFHRRSGRSSNDPIANTSLASGTFMWLMSAQVNATLSTLRPRLGYQECALFDAQSFERMKSGQSTQDCRWPLDTSCCYPKADVPFTTSSRQENHRHREERTHLRASLGGAGSRESSR